MTECADPTAESGSIPADTDGTGPEAVGDSEGTADPEAVADRLKRRSECVRNRELETALQRLDSRGELSSAERRIVARLAVRLTESLAGRWASNLGRETVDLEAALALLADEEVTAK